MVTDFSQVNLNSLTSQPFTNVFTGKQENTPSMKPKTGSSSTPALASLSGNQKPITSNSSLTGKLGSVGNQNVSNSDYYALITGTSKPVAPVIAADAATSRSTTPPPVTPPATSLKQSNIMPAIESTLAGANATVTTPTQEKPKDNLRTSMEQYLQNQMTRDTSAERASLRTEAQTAEKEKEARVAKEKLQARKTYYERLIEEKERNAGGKLTANVRAEIDDISRKANRELADLGVQYETANNDYVAAENIVNERIKDIQAEDTRLSNVFSTMFNYVQNDMTESEKLQAQQAFQTLQDDRQFERDKEIMNYKAALDKQSVAAIMDGMTDNGKPLTDTQSSAYGYAERLVQSDDIINNIGADFTGITSAIGGSLPNILKTDKRQQFEQAQRNFINAVLRRESGAVISPEEFENARLQYFPQVGDSDKTLAQKATNRNTVIQNLYRSAGTLSRYNELRSGAKDPLDFGVNANPLNLDL